MGNRLSPCWGSVGVPSVSERGVIQLEGLLCGEKKEKKFGILYHCVFFGRYERR